MYIIVNASIATLANLQLIVRLVPFAFVTYVAIIMSSCLQAPPLPLMAEFCDRMTGWLSKHPDNVAVVHCKAGKGRTGTMICAYLVHAVRKHTRLDVECSVSICKPDVI